MLSKKRTATHPGEMLQYEFLEPLVINQADLARHPGVPNQRINALVRGKRGITADTAWLLWFRPATTKGQKTDCTAENGQYHTVY